MLNINQETNRLYLFYKEDIGLEKLSLGNFVNYYFKNFYFNIQNHFKEFKRSEIKDFELRYKKDLDYLKVRNNIAWDKIIVPIPKGMKFCYLTTLDNLELILKLIDYTEIEESLDKLTLFFKKEVSLNNPSFDKFVYDKAIGIFQNTYDKEGLTHTLANHAFPYKQDIFKVYDKLLEITSFYEKIIMIEKRLLPLENLYKETNLSKAEDTLVKTHFLSLGYRLSLLAVAFEHIQALEHNFIKAVLFIINHKE